MSALKNVITGFLGAILVALALQVITPPNLVLTSKVDPNSLTGRVVWNTRFELVAILFGFLVGALLGNLQLKRDPKGQPELSTIPADKGSIRECPHCKELMRRDAGVCPHCRRESPAWTFNEGRWWLQSEGEWYWLDDGRGAWVRWERDAAVSISSGFGEPEKPTTVS